MAAQADQHGALEWVLAKLAAQKPKLVFKPPEPLTPAAAAPALPPAAETAAQKLSRLRRTSQREEALWHDWFKSNKSPELFTQLYTSHAPLRAAAVNKFRGVEINKAALHGHATQLYYDALETWDPQHPSGASLKTHITNTLRGLKRFVVKFQNAARITEPTSEKITPFRTARAELTEKLGYEPPLHQIVEYTNSKNWGGKKLSMKDALEVSKYVKRDLDVAAGGDEIEGAGVRANDPFLQAAHIVYHTLKPDEQKVHELLFPRDGSKSVDESGAIARRLGWHVSKVSKAKTVILNKIQARVGG